VPDHVTFDRLFQQAVETKEPFCKTFLTLSSHEPFEVPFKKFEDPYLNSVAYTDHWLGDFVHRMKQLPLWDNTLIVILPDHAMMYPSEMRYDSPERHHIFSLWIGGAVSHPMVINQICSQIDIAATLLNQLGIDHSDLPFSRDVLSPTSEEYAFYTFPNGFGIISPQGYVVYDCNSEQVSLSKGVDEDSLLLKGKAYLQCLYNDIGERK
jgi:phosphoglycerol transferase MdoB-like AlkP superfamily enzyme